jgi:serine/threonine protein kinase
MKYNKKGKNKWIIASILFIFCLIFANSCTIEDSESGLCEIDETADAIFSFSCCGLFVILLLIGIEKYPNQYKSITNSFKNSGQNKRMVTYNPPRPSIQNIQVQPPRQIKTTRRTITKKRINQEMPKKKITSSNISDNFNQKELIGKGGMANVYVAEDKQSGEMVIWKEASTKHHTAKEVNKALLNEIEILKQLDHPRIPKHIDSGTIKNKDGQTVQVLIMQKIDGDGLDKEMKIFIRRKIKQSLDEVTKIILEICDPLEYMADLDPPVFHRDIKPHNIMLDYSNGVSLIDFGLAKGFDAGEGLTTGGMHTVGWAPPERENGNTGGYTDVYSLGQLLWYMLTNERAGIHSEENRITKIEENGHPRWVADLINKAVVPDDPNKRIQSAFEFRIRLENEGNYQE